MSLSESMDRYLAAAREFVGSRQQADRGDPFWLPKRETLTEVLGFDVPEVVWEFWQHELFWSPANGGLVPERMRLRGPQRLFSYGHETFGCLHFSVSEQIPLIQFANDHRISLLGRVGKWPETWVGGWFDGQTLCHQYRFSLEEMFNHWTEGLASGALIWADDHIVVGGHVSGDRWNLDLSDAGSVLRYATLPGQIDESGAIAAGAIMDEDYDIDAFGEEVLAIATERRRRWEASVGPFPIGVLNEAFE